MNSGTLHIPRWVAGVALLATLVAGGVLALGLRDWSGHTVLGAPEVNVTLAKSVAPVTLGNFTNGFSAVLKSALPGVVNIHTSKIVRPRPGHMMPFFEEPFFRQFFGDQFGRGEPRPEREQSLGSGVIISSDGIILTNNHVIDGATDIRVDLADKREFEAKLVGTDAKTDVAVLRINATGLPTMVLGDSSKLQVGDLVFAIGEPFGLDGTATMGIVSATGRSMGGQIESYEDFIQTDAAINPGNSGGALVDVHGNLIGINTAIETGGGSGNRGIGFAIPINMARSVMDQIVTHGKVVRGFLGIHIQDVSPQIAKQFGLSEVRGVLVGDVSPDSPSSRAGLKRGDVILQLNSQAVNSANELRLRISQTAPGTTVKLEVWREGKTQDVGVTLGELPEEEAKTAPGESGGSVMEGVEVQELTPDLAQELGLPAKTRGVVVAEVDPASAAASSLDRGDVIQEVNHRPVASIEQYRQAIAAAGKEPLLLLVNREGVTRYVVVERH